MRLYPAQEHITRTPSAYLSVAQLKRRGKDLRLPTTRIVLGSATVTSGGWCARAASSAKEAEADSSTLSSTALHTTALILRIFARHLNISQSIQDDVNVLATRAPDRFCDRPNAGGMRTEYWMVLALRW